MSERPKAKTRRVVVRYEYLDGTMGVSVEQPSEFDEQVSIVDAALLAEFDATERRLYEIGEQLLAAPKIRNPKYVPDEEPADA